MSAESSSSMRSHFSITTLIIVIVWYAAVLYSTITLGAYLNRNFREMTQITNELYANPFAVSNAANDLKVQMYNSYTLMLRTLLAHGNEHDLNKSIRDEQEIDAQILKDTEIIKDDFQGGMNKVESIEEVEGQWKLIRHDAFLGMKRGNVVDAKDLLRGAGAHQIDAMISLANYILNSAKEKAEYFNTKAEEKRNALANEVQIASALITLSILLIGTFTYSKIGDLKDELRYQATVQLN